MTFWLYISVSVVMLVAGGFVTGGFGWCSMLWWRFLEPWILHEIFHLHFLLTEYLINKWHRVFLSLMVLILSGYDKSLILGQSETLWSLLLQNQHFKLNCYLSVLLLFPDIWNMLLLLIILIVLTFVTRILFCVFTCFNNWSNWKEVRQRG